MHWKGVQGMALHLPLRQMDLHVGSFWQIKRLKQVSEFRLQMLMKILCAGKWAMAMVLCVAMSTMSQRGISSLRTPIVNQGNIFCLFGTLFKFSFHLPLFSGICLVAKQKAHLKQNLQQQCLKLPHLPQQCL